MSRWEKALFALRGAGCAAKECETPVPTNIGVYIFNRDTSKIDFAAACGPAHLRELAEELAAALEPEKEGA